MNFIVLYFVNLLLDFPLQCEFQKTMKVKSNYVLYVHSAIWGLGLSITLMYLGLFAWWKLIMLVVGHYIIDYAKCRRVFNIKDKPAFYIDQALHVLQIIICLI